MLSGLDAHPATLGQYYESLPVHPRWSIQVPPGSRFSAMLRYHHHHCHYSRRVGGRSGSVSVIQDGEVSLPGSGQGLWFELIALEHRRWRGGSLTRQQLRACEQYNADEKVGWPREHPLPPNWKGFWESNDPRSKIETSSFGWEHSMRLLVRSVRFAAEDVVPCQAFLDVSPDHVSVHQLDQIDLHQASPGVVVHEAPLYCHDHQPRYDCPFPTAENRTGFVTEESQTSMVWSWRAPANRKPSRPSRLWHELCASGPGMVAVVWSELDGGTETKSNGRRHDEVEKAARGRKHSNGNWRINTCPMQTAAGLN